MKGWGHFLVLVSAVATTLGGCVAETRYWKADDLTSKRTFYTADTSQAPLGLMGAAVFVSSERTIVGLSNFELRRITEEQFFQFTGGVTVYQDLGGRVSFILPSDSQAPKEPEAHKAPAGPPRPEDGAEGREGR